ncbi:MAG: methylated-DNA--[protein]-cysteine S-methyltransferase [Clostridiales bacterium]|uniref:methylated-DNA--[protein]-cysteine S-methyltransferase n=1 Tax=Clostridium sp. N3C TaxID=1776758 RepID=UPI00092E0679|nr:methylated-DNA--[protein]-cysteine S-methyltransferase [Clostridium sp. N3C]NLZ48396.1 methylated-DNA--[protein]-cysteine S-methyltransferase [Clostridiales bacterium]SCN24249.1 Methylated-DNA-protein-cysteine methyltransferase, constitutive [Clostridium sp. N3C]
MREYIYYYKSPIGNIRVVGDENEILALDFTEQIEINEGEYPKVIKECIAQLEDYFSGKRKNFSIKYFLRGTEFQKKVWEELTKIPYGETVTYKYIAEKIGNEKAIRAVGSTNGKNPISIIIPCHRVVGSKGKLVGYAWGIWRKQWLLEHEKKYKNI